MKLITIDQARWDLRTEPEEDPHLDNLIERASAIVLDYLKTWPAEWINPDTTPAHVRSAVSLVVVSLYENRDGNPINEGVRALLARTRDPAYA